MERRHDSTHHPHGDGDHSSHSHSNHPHLLDCSFAVYCCQLLRREVSRSGDGMNAIAITDRKNQIVVLNADQRHRARDVSVRMRNTQIAGHAIVLHRVFLLRHQEPNGIFLQRLIRSLHLHLAVEPMRRCVVESELARGNRKRLQIACCDVVINERKRKVAEEGVIDAECTRLDVFRNQIVLVQRVTEVVFVASAIQERRRVDAIWDRRN